MACIKGQNGSDRENIMKAIKAITFMGLILFSFCIATHAMAENKPKSFTLTLGLGQHFFECDQNLDSKYFYSLGIGYNFNEKLGFEAMYASLNTQRKSDADVDVYLYRLDALYNFITKQKLVPFIAAGIGGITLDPDTDRRETNPFINYGMGLKYFFNEIIALRGDVRHIISFESDDTFHNLAYFLGMSFSFGGKSKKVSVQLENVEQEILYEFKELKPKRRIIPEVESPPPDSDGDGIFDYLDKCPETPQGVTVDDTGCCLDSDGDGIFDYLDKCPETPQGLTVDDSGCPLDSDGDSIQDYLDECPRTPKYVMVDDAGCPLDSDGDGVFDYLDECAGTPQGATVNARGCWQILGVLFDTAKWDLKSGTSQVLNNIVNVMKNNPWLKVEIQGHTDNIGSKSYNIELSNNRAIAVMEYLIEKGIDVRRISAKGFGFSQPVASNDTSVGRALNRRVVLLPK